MKAMILEFVRNSTQGDMYEKALQCLKAMRKACKDNDEPDKFNEFLHDLKRRYSIGIHKEFYTSIRNERVGLVTKDESFKSKVTPEEFNEFFGLASVQEEVQEPKEEAKEKDGEEMFDEIE